MDDLTKRPQAPALPDFAPQGAVYDGLTRSLEEGTFVHAYLISGPEGVGKRTLAGLMAQYLLCTGEDKPCGRCPGCLQTAEGSHPDMTILRPDKSIQVDAVREVIRLSGEHTYEGGRRVIRIEQAEKMTPGAQNCLLKTLEEPVAGTVFLLTTDAPSQLLPTIVSRCRGLKLHPWPDSVVLSVLAEHGVDERRRREAADVSGGSIGMALRVAADESYWQRRGEVLRDFFGLSGRSDVMRVSGIWKDRKDQAGELLGDVEDMIRSLMLVSLGLRDARALDAYPESWKRVARSNDPAAFARLLDAVAEARRLQLSQVTWQAVVERLLLRLMEENHRWST